jgi:hypothetical protein
LFDTLQQHALLVSAGAGKQPLLRLLPLLAHLRQPLLQLLLRGCLPGRKRVCALLRPSYLCHVSIQGLRHTRVIRGATAARRSAPAASTSSCALAVRSRGRSPDRGTLSRARARASSGGNALLTAARLLAAHPLPTTRRRSTAYC